METGLIIITIVSVVICVVGMLYAGSQRGKPSNKNKIVSGVLHVDCRDSEHEPGMLLSLSVPVADVVGKKQIVLDVNVIKQNSQK